MATRTVRPGVVLVASLGLSLSASASAYVPAGSYAQPGGAWSVLDDGRVIAIDNERVLVQDAVNASTYSVVGTIPGGLINGTASFVAVSPDGATIAFGDNNFGVASDPRVHFLETASLDTGVVSPVFSIGAANFAGAWAGSTLFVSGTDAFGASAYVTRIDASSLGTLTSELAISNVGGASGGVASDGARLYTANGYDNGPGGSETGTIRAFSLDALDFGDVAIDFEADGTMIADVLSGSPLGFDHLGNLLIGGGDYDEGDTGYAGVADAGAVQAAAGGGPVVAGASVQRLSPGGAFDFYSITPNHATGEVLVTYFGDPNVYRYAIPAPGVLLAFGAPAMGVCARRRRCVALPGAREVCG